MRTYTLTDRDFEEFYAIIEKVEAETELKHGKGIATVGQYSHDSIRRSYRYQLIGWRSQVMSGDTYHRGPDAPRDNMAQYLKQEIKRLQALLPPEKEQP